MGQASCKSPAKIVKYVAKCSHLILIKVLLTTLLRIWYYTDRQEIADMINAEKGIMMATVTVKNYTGVVLKSHNQKLGNAMATMRPVGATCPSDCPLLGKGCYAQKFHQNMVSKDVQTDPALFDVNMAEATAKHTVGKARRPKLLRFHVSGDIMLDGNVDETYVSVLTKWARRYMELKIPVINYTHVWRNPLARAIQCFTRASTHNVLQTVQAVRDGWHVAMQIGKGQSAETKKILKEYGLTGVQCPWQTHKIPCSQCKLCEVKGNINTIVLLEKH